MQYTVQGQRSDQSGPLSEIFMVNFGQAPGGGLTASVLGAHGLEAHTTGFSGANHRLEADASTVNGRAVQKVLPNGNGSGKRANARK